jgi:hypothetical protein
MNTLRFKFQSLIRWTPPVLRDASAIFREKGMKGVFQRFGWKFFAAFFAYYLIRDLTIYVLIPWYLSKGFI